MYNVDKMFYFIQQWVDSYLTSYNKIGSLNKSHVTSVHEANLYFKAFKRKCLCKSLGGNQLCTDQQLAWFTYLQYSHEVTGFNEEVKEKN